MFHPPLAMTIPLAPALEITGLAALFVLYSLARQVGQSLREIGRAARFGRGGGAL